MVVLISAYACEPNKGSEPGVGWNWVQQIAKRHQALVITRANNRKSIEDEMLKNPNPNLTFHYVDLPDWASLWKKGQKGVYPYYYIWQFLAYQKAKSLCLRHKVSLVHHITFVIDWVPSFMFLLPIPFIWGPIGSNSDIPAVFFKTMPIKLRIKEYFRSLTKRAFSSFDPFLNSCRLRATKIVLINRHSYNKLPKAVVSKTVVVPAIGVEPIPRCESVHKKRTMFTILSIGDKRNVKGSQTALAAFNAFVRNGGRGICNIIGNDEAINWLSTQARKLGIEDRVEFERQMPRKEFLKKLYEIDVLLFPSFEGGGMVVLEAMSRSIPVVCLDYGGPGEMITSDCGFKVAVTQPHKVTRDLAEALRMLSLSSDLRRKMGEAGRRRVSTLFEWDAKGKAITELYGEICSNFKNGEALS